MTTLQEQHAELIALTELYLLREYEIKDWLLADSETYSYFKQLAEKKEPKPAPRQAAPPKKPPPQPKPLLKPKQTPQKAPTSSFKRELQAQPEAHDLQQMKKLMKTLLPDQQILDVVPDDSHAKKKNRLWEQPTTITDVIILSFDEKLSHKTLLHNIAKAIDRSLIPARVVSALDIEQQKGWDSLLNTENLKLVIASQTGLNTLPELLKYYKEQQKDGKRYLNKKPLILLADLSHYLREPNLKPALWKAIVQSLSL